MDNIIELSLDLDKWSTQLRAVKKPRSYNINPELERIKTGTAFGHHKRKKKNLEKCKNHNMWAQLPIHGLNCVRAIALRDIIKLEGTLYRKHLTIDRDNPHILIITINQSIHKLILRYTNEVKQ